MKVSNDLLIGIAIGAGIAMLLNGKQITSGPVKNPKTLPPMKPPALPQSRMAGDWYPRRAYVGDLRQQYTMPAWYAA